MTFLSRPRFCPGCAKRKPGTEFPANDAALCGRCERRLAELIEQREGAAS